MKNLSLAVFVLSAIIWTNAFAENRWLVGGAVGLASFDDEVDVVDNVNLFLKFGYGIGDHLELGASYGITLFTDDINNVDHDLDIGMLYIKGKLPINDNSQVYLMLGATRIKLTEAIRDSSLEIEDEGTGFGHSFGYSAEYVIYYDDDEFDRTDIDVTSTGFNFGFVKYF